MAELTQATLDLGEQLRAILGVRWQLMRNGMRTTRGALEAISQAWIGLWFTVLGLGGAVGFAFGAWHFLARGDAVWLSALLWPLFLFWQIFPLAATAFSDRLDVSSLARYPLDFRSYSLVRVAFGSFDVANVVGGLCTLGLVIGAMAARPSLAPVAILAGVLFAAFNLLLAQMIAAWLERWLAKRRTREILSLVFFLVIIGINFLGPISRHWSDMPRGVTAARLPWLAGLATWLPPGLPAEALSGAARGAAGTTIAALALLAVCAAVVLRLLSIRLRAEYAGEVVTDVAVPARSGRVADAAAVRAARVPHAGARASQSLDGPVGAIARKELGYVRRSPYMFFSLAMPIVLLVLFAVGGFSGSGGLSRSAASYAYPIGLAYALLTFTNLIFNVCGADAGGVQLYFVAPVRFRQILAGKNLAYAVLLAIEAAVLYAVAWLLGDPPGAVILAASLLGYAFAILCAFTAGNLVSLYMPKKMDLARVGRHAARGVSSMIAMAVQALAIGLAVLAMVAGYTLHRPLLGLLMLALWIALAALLYTAVLRQSDRLALAQRDTLLAELTKA